MNRWMQTGGWVLFGLLALWVVFKVVSVIFGIVSWIVSTAISLVVVAGLLYLAYVAVSRFTGGPKRPREQERLLE